MDLDSLLDIQDHISSSSSFTGKANGPGNSVQPPFVMGVPVSSTLAQAPGSLGESGTFGGYSKWPIGVQSGGDSNVTENQVDIWQSDAGYRLPESWSQTIDHLLSQSISMSPSHRILTTR